MSPELNSTDADHTSQPETAPARALTQQQLAYVTSVQRLLEAGDWSVLKRVVANLSGVDLNVPIERGNTIVHFVARYGDLGESISCIQLFSDSIQFGQ